MDFKVASKRIGQGIWKYTKTGFSFIGSHTWLLCLVLGLVLNFIIECLHRHSFAEGCLHIVKSPLPFLFNALIMTTVMAISSLSKRRLFFYCFFGALFLGFGIANCVLLSMRVTPLEGADLQIVKISLITKYLNTFEIALIVVVILAALVALGILFFKLPKLKVNYLKESLASILYAAVLLVSLLSFRASGILLSEHTKNLAGAYKNYGFNYCFLCSVFDTGIDKPEVYNELDLNNIIESVNNAADKNTAVKEQAQLVQNGEQSPNVIFIQLETFFDVNHLSKVEFSENPIPNFSALHNNYSSGYLGVPSIGAGTANTEFEVISGMSLNHFGMGEYPYKTVLQNNPCESICYNLKNHGYKAHAIHNNTAIFYDRDLVFANLGFDTFTALEHMQDVNYTVGGWAKDDVLLGCINDCLDSSKDSDVIYTITVQGHGKYPSDYEDELVVNATGFSEDEDVNREFNYYINQLYEVDQFIGELLTSLQKRDERTVVVMFGDHLPSFEISADDLEGGDLFATEYVIWDNFGLEKRNMDIPAYQISSHVMELLGYDDGMLTKVHQNYKDATFYSDWLRTIEYDMLYGNKYAFGGNDYLYKTTDLKLGVKDIILTDVTVNEENGILTVTGEWFTEYSRIQLNNSNVNTVFVDNFTLMTESSVELTTGDHITVAQIADGGKVLSNSNYYLVGGAEETPPVTGESSDASSTESSLDQTTSDATESSDSESTPSENNPTDGNSSQQEIIYEKVGFKLSTSIAIIVAGLALIAVSTAAVFIFKQSKSKENDQKDSKED